MLSALSPVRALADERSSTLLLSVAAPADESERLVAVTRELLAPLSVSLELRQVARVDVAELRHASASGYFARVWIALSPSGSARLYLEHGASNRLLVRDVPGDPSNPELVREELGHILQTAVEGLKAGEEVGEPRQQALRQVLPADAPKAAPATPEPVQAGEPHRRSTLLRVGARYEARWLGDGARVEDGPGVFVALASPFGVELGAYYRRPIGVEARPVGVRLQTLSLRGLATLAAGPVRLGAGLGADLVRVSPVAESTPGVELNGAHWRKLGLARLQASYGWRLFRPFELQVSAGLDWDLSDTRYVFLQSAGDATVLEPSPLRPFVALGASLP